MTEKWAKLFTDFEESGYRPSDIQRIVMVYEMTRENDEMLKEMFAESKRENLKAGKKIAYIGNTPLEGIN